MTLANKITDFLFNVKIPFTLPNEVGVLNVHHDKKVQEACLSFYKKFYSNNRKRNLLLGINPGRFGGGVTGIPFTDPIRLEKYCGITTDFQKKQELSSVFMYDMMNAYGGPKEFYDDFYISSISPLGFVKGGKNLNYYDDKLLLEKIQPFVITCLQKQISWGLNAETCFCIGEGENLKYLTKLNEENKFFKNIIAVPHPRFIMQYKLKQKEEYIDLYLKRFKG